MYDSILVPTDGSDVVDRTLDHALPIAEWSDATVHALYVIDQRITQAADDDTTAEVRSSLESEGADAVATVVGRAQDRGLDTVETVRTGTPWKEILEYAERTGIDLIVIGAHGKSPREKLTSMGSVSDRVVDNASVPVFVVRS